MNIHTQHPEYQQTVHAMRAGHLPASAEDIASVEGKTAQPKDTHTCSNNYEGHHPDYVAYCEYAKSLGYHCIC